MSGFLKCPDCGRLVMNGYRHVCRMPAPWVCACGEANRYDMGLCGNCGRDKSDAAADTEDGRRKTENRIGAGRGRR